MQQRLDLLHNAVRASKVEIELLMKLLKIAEGPAADELRVKIATEQARLAQTSAELAQLEGIYKGGAIAAPINGTAIIADPQKMLGKAVTGKDALLRVAHVKGEWQADVWFAQEDIGRLIQHLKQAKGQRVNVELAVAALAGKKLKGTLHHDDLAAEPILRDKEDVLYARVRLDAESLKLVRALPVDAKVRVTVNTAGVPR
jgi:hypothetical protein